MEGMRKYDSVLLAEIANLIFNSCRLLDQIFMAVVCYLFAETLKTSGN